MTGVETSEAEAERLHVLEDAFNPGTRRWLSDASIRPGSRCLVVGAGTDSTVATLRELAGPQGIVGAIDTSSRSWCQPSAESWQPSASVIAATTKGQGPFDLVHARFALSHAAARIEILSAMVEAVKLGGLLILEEPDFGSARALAGPENLRRAFNNVHSAIELVFGSLGLDYAFGARIPALLEDYKFCDISIENDASIVPGRAPIAEVMTMSATLFATAYVATGFATLNDIDRYRKFTREPTCWATYCAIVRGIGRRQ